MHKTHLLISALALVTIALPVHAQEGGKIVIIGDDGKEMQFEVPQAPAAQPVVVAPRQPKEPEAPPVKWIEPQEIKKEAITAPPPAKPVKPQTEVKAQQPAQKPKAKEKVAAVSKIPLPPHKPYALTQRSQAPYTPPELMKPASGGITKDYAIHKALQVAPPARRYRAFFAQHNGTPVYAVTFDTENGPHDILVDARTGEIVKR